MNIALRRRGVDRLTRFRVKGIFGFRVLGGFVWVCWSEKTPNKLDLRVTQGCV